MTVKELHEKFDRCCKEGIPFEYECLWDGYEAVRHTDLGYCMLISEEDAAMKEALYGDDLFYELERDDGRYLYEIEMRSGRTEYSCDVDASTGAIYDWDVDYD